MTYPEPTDSIPMRFVALVTIGLAFALACCVWFAQADPPTDHSAPTSITEPTSHDPP